MENGAIGLALFFVALMAFIFAGYDCFFGNFCIIERL